MVLEVPRRAAAAEPAPEPPPPLDDSTNGRTSSGSPGPRGMAGPRPPTRKPTHYSRVQQELREGFALLDADGDGTLTIGEVKAALYRLGVGPGMADRIVSLTDADGNGTISYTEWENGILNASRQNHKQILSIIERIKNDSDAAKAARGDPRLSLVSSLARSPRSGMSPLPPPVTDEPSRALTCVRRHYFWVLVSNSTPRIVWDLVMALWLFWIAVSMPFMLAFERSSDGGSCYGGCTRASGWSVRLNMIIDIMFMADVVLNFFTGFQDGDGVEVVDQAAITKKYLRTWFTLDFVSSVPFDCIMDSLTLNLQPAKLLKLSKITKVFKIFRLSKVMKIFRSDSSLAESFDDFIYRPSTQTAFKVASILVAAGLLCHWLACLMALSGDGFLRNYTPSSKYASSRGMSPTPDDWAIWRRYLAALYWALTTMTTVGYGDLLPQTDLERAATMVAMIVGGSFYGFVIAQISAIIGSTDLQSRRFCEKMDLVAGWLDHHDFPKDLNRRVRRYLQTYLQERTALDEQAILESLNPRLRQDIGHHLVHDDVAYNPLFEMLPFGSLARLASVISFAVAVADELIVRVGDTGHAMFIVKAGIVQQTHLRDGQEANTHLNCTDSFGEEVLLGLHRTYNFSCHAHSAVVELHIIPTEDFHERFANIPDVLASMKAFLIETSDEFDDVELRGSEAHDITLVERVVKHSQPNLDQAAALEKVMHRLDAMERDRNRSDRPRSSSVSSTAVVDAVQVDGVQVDDTAASAVFDANAYDGAPHEMRPASAAFSDCDASNEARVLFSAAPPFAVANATPAWLRLVGAATLHDAKGKSLLDCWPSPARAAAAALLSSARIRPRELLGPCHTCWAADRPAAAARQFTNLLRVVPLRGAGEAAHDAPAQLLALFQDVTSPL
ncbi:hypothetical protein M885DRAFT_548358 [Pelagophyceae sp. CCMP2097]|nr:hypothetical protein M885DRAFT_548358 [Pelagophyceae sp. CCMP2097]|mmetsp:Transcript_19427/g.65643  ORF Transcript_19427/g.65643 Transcript_19427/m.65643 type:complete len:899 (+) Transcript_19427:208-2904(+)